MHGTITRFLSNRLRECQGSPTLSRSERAKVLRARGVDVIDLSAGDPHFATPEHIRRAAEEALSRGETHYVESSGLPALRRAIARKLAEENELHHHWEREILVTAGVKPALCEAALALVEPGVDVLLLEPAYVSYAPMVELAGGRPVRLALRAEDGFRVRFEALVAAATDRLRAIVLNSPNNPTGRVLAPEELEAVARFARERDLVIFSDEVYEKLVYDGRKHRSIGSLPGMAERTLTFNGFSKSYAMTGWRLGYVAGPSGLIDAIRTVHSHAATCVAPFVQQAGLRALEGPQDCVGEAVATYERCRRLLVEGLNRLRGVRCAMPEGAFYALADVRGVGVPVEEILERLDEAGVVATPGAAFGEASAGHIRFAYSAPPEQITEALVRMARVLEP